MRAYLSANHPIKNDHRVPPTLRHLHLYKMEQEVFVVTKWWVLILNYYLRVSPTDLKLVGIVFCLILLFGCGKHVNARLLWCTNTYISYLFIPSWLYTDIDCLLQDGWETSGNVILFLLAFFTFNHFCACKFGLTSDDTITSFKLLSLQVTD